MSKSALQIAIEPAVEKILDLTIDDFTQEVNLIVGGVDEEVGRGTPCLLELDFSIGSVYLRLLKGELTLTSQYWQAQILDYETCWKLGLRLAEVWGVELNTVDLRHRHIPIERLPQL